MLPAATIAEGILGLEGQHQWNGGVTLGVPGYPRFKLDRITGLHSLPEADDNRESAQARIGEVVYPSLARGKTVTYEGRVQARTLPELRTQANALRAAFGERSAVGQMIVRPHPSRGGVGWLYYARVLACDLDDAQERGPSAPYPWQRGFVLSLRQIDPRYYSENELQSLANANTTTALITNSGNAPGEPHIVVYGAVSGEVTLDKVDGGGALLKRVHFTNVPVLAGQSMNVDFATRTAAISTGANGKLFLNDSDTTWWDEGVAGIEPNGVTRIKGSGLSSFDVYWRHASW